MGRIGPGCVHFCGATTSFEAPRGTLEMIVQQCRDAPAGRLRGRVGMRPRWMECPVTRGRYRVPGTGRTMEAGWACPEGDAGRRLGGGSAPADPGKTGRRTGPPVCCGLA